jgi:hypothetical protein
MSCLYCGSRLISKTEAGLACCGCGRPLDQTRPPAALRWSIRKTLVLLFVGVLLVPLVGPMAASDRARPAVAAAEAE